MGQASAVAALAHLHPSARDWGFLLCWPVSFVHGRRHVLLRGGLIPVLALGSVTAPLRRRDKGMGGGIEPPLASRTPLLGGGRPQLSGNGRARVLIKRRQ